jgi:hypothetical protein
MNKTVSASAKLPIHKTVLATQMYMYLSSETQWGDYVWDLVIVCGGSTARLATLLHGIHTRGSWWWRQ